MSKVICVSVDELKLFQMKIIKRNRICNIIGFGLFLINSFLIFKITIPIKIGVFYIIFLSFLNAIVCVLLMVIVKGIVNGNNIEKFYKEFKKNFVLKSLKSFFKDIDYNSEEGFTEEYIRDVGMIDTGDSFNSNDYISGTYNGIKFEQSDIHIEEKHVEEDDDDKEEVWETIFMGRLMVFDFNKNFKANLQVSSLGFRANSFLWGKKIIDVEMEDIEFNKLFSVCAENEHDAFYILTPHFMEKLKEITRRLECDVMFCFFNSKLFIAVDNRDDSFEYDILKPINEKDIEASIESDIKLITSFVDELNLDNDLFRREV